MSSRAFFYSWAALNVAAWAFFVWNSDVAMATEAGQAALLCYIAGRVSP
jgi:hypothetical protein